MCLNLMTDERLCGAAAKDEHDPFNTLPTGACNSLPLSLPAKSESVQVILV